MNDLNYLITSKCEHLYKKTYFDFSGSCVFQRQTLATNLNKQLLLLLNLERVIRSTNSSPSFYSEKKYSKVENNQDNIPMSDHAVLRETAKTPRPSISLFMDLSMLNVKDHDSTIRKL